MITRRFERYEVLSQATWDFFSGALGPRPGVVTNVSRGGCRLHTTDLIEHRRWLRILAGGRGNLAMALVGRVIRGESAIKSFSDRVMLYRYGIEFARPGAEAEGCPLPAEPNAIFLPAPDNVAYLVTEPQRRTSGREFY